MNNVYDVVNNDHSIQFTYVGDPTTAPTLSGSALNFGDFNRRNHINSDRFALAQFHFHWGLRNGQGSEHLLQGQEYDMELHLVHYNHDKYRNLNQALASRSNGVVVLAIFYKVFYFILFYYIILYS